MNFPRGCVNQSLILKKKGLNIFLSSESGPWSSSYFKSMKLIFSFAKQNDKTFPRYPKIPVYRHKNDISWKPIANQNNVKRINKKKKKPMDQNIENLKDQEKKETMSDEQYFSSHVTMKHLALLGFC